MATKANIAKAALKKLRVIEGNETPNGNDDADAKEKYDELYALLAVRDAVTWALADTVPDEANDAVVTLLAYHLADQFYIDEGRIARLRTEAYGPDFEEYRCAFSTLRELSAVDYTSHPTPALYY